MKWLPNTGLCILKSHRLLTGDTCTPGTAHQGKCAPHLPSRKRAPGRCGGQCQGEREDGSGMRRKALTIFENRKISFAPGVLDGVEVTIGGFEPGMITAAF